MRVTARDFISRNIITQHSPRHPLQCLLSYTKSCGSQDLTWIFFGFELKNEKMWLLIVIKREARDEDEGWHEERFCVCHPKMRDGDAMQLHVSCIAVCSKLTPFPPPFSCSLLRHNKIEILQRNLIKYCISSQHW